MFATKSGDTIFMSFTNGVAGVRLNKIILLSSMVVLSALLASAEKTSGVAPGAPITLVNSVNDLGRIAHSLKRSLAGVANEVDRIEGSESDPDILDRAFLDDQMFTPITPGSTGILPPRKEWLDLYLYQIEKLTSLLQTEMNNVAAQIDGESSFDVKEMQRIAGDLQADVPRMIAIAKGQTCDDDQVQTAAHTMYQDVVGFDNCRRQLAKSMKKIASGKSYFLD